MRPDSFMEKEFLRLLDSHRPDPIEVAGLRCCMDALNEITLYALGTNYRVKPFGSMANGFGTKGSDLDATCYCEGLEEQDAQLALQELKLRLLPMLKRHADFEVVEEIWSARVPILKLRYGRRFDVDLSCHNPQALQNTALLRAYSSLSPAVRDMVMAVKLWTKAEGIVGAPSRHLSSYSFTLMALYFLQVQPGMQFPCLPTHAFNLGGSSSLAAGTWGCPVPVSLLFAGFITFFATEFHWGSEVVSVRLGKREAAKAPAFEQLPGRLGSRMHIEDPFLLGRNLNCVLGASQEEDLRKIFWRSHEILSTGRSPISLFPPASMPAPLQVPVPEPEPPSSSHSPSGSVVDKIGLYALKVAGALNSDTESTNSGGRPTRQGANATAWLSNGDSDSEAASLSSSRPLAPKPTEVPMSRLIRFSF